MYLIKMLKVFGFDIVDVWGSTSGLIYHPRFAQKFGGVNSALLFAGLAECERMALDKAYLSGFIGAQDSKEELAMKISGLWAEATDKTITHITGLTKSRQRTSLKKLKALDLVQEQIEGLPARRFIKINFVKAVEYLK